MIQREKVIPKDVESNVEFKKASSCFTYADNIPFMAILGIILSYAGTCIAFINFPKCQTTLEKYVDTTSTIVYMELFVIYLVLVHVSVFMHSVAIAIMETTREACHRTTLCECCTSRCKKISRKTCSGIWAIVGTTAMFFQYAGCIAFFSISSTSSLVSFVMKETCKMYENLIEEYIQKGESYIDSAKTLLHQTNNMTMHVLFQYNEMMALQESYKNTAFMQMENVNMGPSLMEKRRFGRERFSERYLSSSSFNPISAIERGQDTLAVLNQTIANVESNLDLYKTHLSQTVVFCNDYGGMYSYLFEITIAAGLFLVAHFILYATHQKNFTIWFYEEKYFR